MEMPSDSRTRRWQDEDGETHEYNYFNMPFDGIQRMFQAISDLEVVDALGQRPPAPTKTLPVSLARFSQPLGEVATSPTSYPKNHGWFLLNRVAILLTVMRASVCFS